MMVRRVDNSSIQCSHGKVSVAKVSHMKRISTGAWSKLLSMVRSMPLLFCVHFPRFYQDIVYSLLFDISINSISFHKFTLICFPVPSEAVSLVHHTCKKDHESLNSSIGSPMTNSVKKKNINQHSTCVGKTFQASSLILANHIPV